jgi:putative DNA methylase
VTDQVKTRKKLIEVALPLDAINTASAREKSIRHGHPSTLHLWWARRPLATARAVLFGQMVDDPASAPEEFPTEEDQNRERQRLFRIIEQLVQWENTSNERVLSLAREEIWRSWRRTCADNRQHPRAAEIFNPEKPPAFHDPFAGGGSIPLEAQRLGLASYASELNPVAVLINKAMIEVPPKFAGCPPVNPEARRNRALFTGHWKGAEGLAEDVLYYGKWVRDEAEKRIGRLYPKIEITKQMAQRRPDLKPFVGRRLTVIAWLWARTIKSPNPAFSDVAVPLASTFLLATKPGKEAYVEPVVDGRGYRFTVKVGPPADIEATRNGTKLQGANFRCILSGSPITSEYIKAEGQAGRMGSRLMAIVAEGERSRVYLEPTSEMEAIAAEANPVWRPDGPVPARLTGGTCVPYGLNEWYKLFTDRQLMALTTFSDLVVEAHERISRDAQAAGSAETPRVQSTLDLLRAGGYADALALYLGCALDKSSVYWSSLCPWLNQPKNEIVGNTFGRQALPMIWDYAEANPFSDSGGNLNKQVDYIAEVIRLALPSHGFGVAVQSDARVQNISVDKVVSTDPPYFDNVSYADLSDFFYVWLRRFLKPFYPELFATVAVPKSEELIAAAYRHHSKEQAEAFFLEGMTAAMGRLAEQAHAAFPVTIYYAFKQAETSSLDGTASTGWETFLESVIRAGFGLSGTWPMRTERPTALKTGTNALASSIVLVCRPARVGAPTATRREFVAALKAELPAALAHQQRGNIAPVDLAQAAIGPGMAVYTRFARVIDAAGKPISVRQALALINQTLDEALAEQEGDFDSDTRWALAWFDDVGFAENDYGRAEVLSKAKNTSIDGMVQAGILVSKAGKVRLLRPQELRPDWDPHNYPRLTVWESVHQLIRALEHGEESAAELIARLNSQADIARELAYRLYTICDRKNRASEARAYNGLVQSWPEIARLAQDNATRNEIQAELL